MNKIKIDVNEIKALFKRRDEINAIPIAEIQWMDGDQEITVTQETLNQWRFMGLSNCSFIEYEIYVDGLEES